MKNCPMCEASKSPWYKHQNSNATFYTCGTWVGVSGKKGQSDKCRIRELEAEREQWECNWNDAADYDLCKELAEGREVAAPITSVSGKIQQRIHELETLLKEQLCSK